MRHVKQKEPFQSCPGKKVETNAQSLENLKIEKIMQTRIFNILPQF